MNRIALVAAALAALCCAPARADFVYDETALPAVKSNLHPIPLTADPRKYIQASDYNAIKLALEDLRHANKNGLFHGLKLLTVDPNPSLADSSFGYMWLREDYQLLFNIPEFTTANIAMGFPTVKGDMLVWNGTGFVKLAAGSNTQVLTADSAMSTGLKWAAAVTFTQIAVQGRNGAGDIDLSGGSLLATLGPTAAVAGDKVTGIVQTGSLNVQAFDNVTGFGSVLLGAPLRIHQYDATDNSAAVYIVSLAH